MRLDLRPISQRTIGVLQQAFSDREVAFFLGAGVDRLLWQEANAGGNNPADWRGMIGRLHLDSSGGSTEPMDALGHLIESWPTEIAFLSRAHIGDEAFKQKVCAEIADDSTCFKANIAMPCTKALCEALVKCNLIVTTNYSGHIRRALEAYLADLPRKVTLISLNREDLKGFVFPRTSVDNCATRHLSGPERIYLVHIHGRCSPGSFPVLDSWGYNAVQEDDLEYTQFLKSLFTYRHVVTVGVSWTDIPLRNAAAYVKRVRPYLQRAHVDLRYEEDPSVADQPSSPVRGWVNAMRSIYGVEIVYTGSENQAHLLGLLNRERRLPSENDLEEVADFLDATGDYESPLQSQWLGSVGSPATPDFSHAVVSGVEALHLKVIDAAKNRQVSWAVLARIERHLRHQIWMYVKNPNDRAAKRRQLWETLACWYVEDPKVQHGVDSRLHFDFAVGMSEVYAGPGLSFKPSRKQIDSETLQGRLDMAPRIWPTLPSGARQPQVTMETLRDQAALVRDLLNLGWEAIAAKALSDRLFSMAKLINKSPTDTFNSKVLLDEAYRSAVLASEAGCTRRRVKSDVLASIWNPDPREGRARLIGELQSGGNSFEPGLRAAITVGLAGCYIRLTPKEQFAIADVQHAVEEVGMSWDDVTAKDLEYWLAVAPQEIQDCYRVLIGAMGSENSGGPNASA